MKKAVQAKFIKTAILNKDYPIIRSTSGDILPEVAVVGRSNVGKSSLLNHLFEAKHLVKTSATPGKTQALNFFSLNDQIAFADLPGYGYAKVPPSVRKEWGPMVRSYLESRESLKLILFLLDIRRIPNEEDIQFLEWVLYHEKALILVLTKIDKVNQKELRLNTTKILDTLSLMNLHHLYYSVPKNRGRKELMIMIQDALNDEDKQE
ncbi:ribosome biogenesis GTP-binding protein YihA/YsxC [Candidatus Protochlamydia amoebophila]|uniref:Probable GTP-binding protein EngB n=1 Tax=Candidatus Protochlamydia amoebophila TaxID=362787 RepID=A0A0C1HGY3_9BACT|nr:ribosome biogenesis GTP-binding protein YihA/YsxC [Candidatus Protochlamydia amoebophila]KIC73923.1 putative GTP-binding protein EngB [Candidatus Protochlamydia amoebophila]